VNCSIYGSYFEYLAEPKLRDIQPNGPGAGKLRENDTLVSVDGAAITTPAAWHRLRDARAGDTVRLGVRREGALVETSIVASMRRNPVPLFAAASRFNRSAFHAR
jgi:predicted metalloprotease with PDZ domain